MREAALFSTPASHFSSSISSQDKIKVLGGGCTLLCSLHPALFVPALHDRPCFPCRITLPCFDYLYPISEAGMFLGVTYRVCKRVLVHGIGCCLECVRAHCSAPGLLLLIKLLLLM